MRKQKYLSDVDGRQAYLEERINLRREIAQAQPEPLARRRQVAYRRTAEGVDVTPCPWCGKRDRQTYATALRLTVRLRYYVCRSCRVLFRSCEQLAQTKAT
jgi:hypothetical protein